jgi:hypothetical protein
METTIEQAPLAQKSQFETFKAQGGQIVDKVKELIHEGNVRRIVIKQDDDVVVEFPLTVGVIGAVLAPTLAAIGAAAALLTSCTIEVERTSATPELPAPEGGELEEVIHVHDEVLDDLQPQQWLDRQLGARVADEQC